MLVEQFLRNYRMFLMTAQRHLTAQVRQFHFQKLPAGDRFALKKFSVDLQLMFVTCQTLFRLFKLQLGVTEVFRQRIFAQNDQLLLLDRQFLAQFCKLILKQIDFILLITGVKFNKQFSAFDLFSGKMMHLYDFS